jgi:hypothetical protein
LVEPITNIKFDKTKQMKNIQEHIKQVFELYFTEFYQLGQHVRLCEQIRLQEELRKMLKLETTDMPYWFVKKLEDNGFKID